MSFVEYVKRRKFFGQEKIVKELALVAEEVKKGRKLNLLFQAASGYGKTTLIYHFLAYVDVGYKNSFQYVPDNAGKVSFDLTRVNHFLDEAHELKTPEPLYPLMDSEKYLIIIATNEYDKLKEPLRNRCLEYNFVPYSEESLARMLHTLFTKRKVGLPFLWCKELVPYTRGNPRIARNLVARLGFVISAHGFPSDTANLHTLVYELLGTEEEGFTHYDRLYLETLENIGGTASLTLMKSLINLPKKVILEEIEPFLVMKGKIRITSKGRKVISD